MGLARCSLEAQLKLQIVAPWAVGVLRSPHGRARARGACWQGAPEQPTPPPYLGRPGWAGSGPSLGPAVHQPPLSPPPLLPHFLPSFKLGIRRLCKHAAAAGAEPRSVWAPGEGGALAPHGSAKSTTPSCLAPPEARGSGKGRLSVGTPPVSPASEVGLGVWHSREMWCRRPLPV